MLRRIVISAIATGCIVIGSATAANAADSPPGYYYGVDGTGPLDSGSAPYTLGGSGSPPAPTCSNSHLGAYIGEVGNEQVISSSNPYGYIPDQGYIGFTDSIANDADTNHFSYSIGEGTGGFFWMYGPDYNIGSASKPVGANLSPSAAYTFGEQQGYAANQDWQRWYAGGTHRMPFRIIWADIEAGSGSAPSGATPNGWWLNGATNSTDALADFNTWAGFSYEISYLGTGLTAGVYSSGNWSNNDQWTTYMGSNALYAPMWTSEADNTSPTPCAVGFVQGSNQAAFFGPNASANAQYGWMWQWSESGYGDYDQIDTNLIPSGY
jgi:hypothetical protein